MYFCVTLNPADQTDPNLANDQRRKTNDALLLHNLADGSGAYRVAAFADRET